MAGDHEEARSPMFHRSHADSASDLTKTPRIGVRTIVLLGLAVLMAALVFAAGAPAKKAPKGFFGITDGGAVSVPDYQKMHDVKVRSKRLSINWKVIEPQPGSFNWSHIDSQVNGLAQNGMSPVFVFWGAPEWATGSSNAAVPPLKGSALQAWKAFVKTAVKRYKKGGVFWKSHPTVPEKPAKTWQIWNEPNLAKYFAKKGSPSRLAPHAPKAYAKFVKASDKSVHKADKHATLILAGLSSGANSKGLKPEKFIKKFLKVKKVTKHFDAAALHPYAPNIKSYESRINKFRKALKKGGAKKKPLWLTEVGWGSAKNGQGLNKGKAGQAKLLKKSFKTTLEKRKKWKIEHLYWFDWRDPPKGAPAGCSFCTTAGLLKNNSKPKPAFKQFKKFTR
jgi:polysaccharide biosynthesis protein PslG